MRGYVEFEFDLPSALLLGLVRVFDEMEGARLNLTELNEIPEEQGVYQLLLDDRLVYIGKTDAEAGLRKRLERHASSILHRQNLDAANVKFKAVRVFVFTAIDLETQLIQHHGGVRNVEWNGSGFGANDPGRQRDHTKVKSGSFDDLYPIDIDLNIDFKPLSSIAAAMLAAVKQRVPYVFRYETGATARQPHDELMNTMVPEMGNNVTARQVVAHVVSHLPGGWQATKLPGRMIIYREQTDYLHGEIIARS